MSGAPIRIAQVMGKMVGGGVESVVMNYFRHIDRRAFRFDFIVDSDSTKVPEKEIKELGGSLIEVPPYQQLHTYQKSLRRVFKTGCYAIAHSHINTLSAFPLHEAKKAGIPIRIAHMHATEATGEFKRNIAKRILKPTVPLYATHLAACTQMTGDWAFSGRHYGIITNAIEVDRFKFSKVGRCEVRREYGLGDSCVVGAVGRLVHVKNYPFLLRIFREVKNYGINAKLLLVGDGPLCAELNGLAKSLEIEEDVIFAGYQDGLGRIYSAMDIVCVTSFSEGFSMTALEAQCSGLPVVASLGVPLDANVTGNMRYLSLDAPLSTWVNCICETATADRENAYKRLGAYDVEKASKRLEAIYSNMMTAGNPR